MPTCKGREERHGEREKLVESGFVFTNREMSLPLPVTSPSRPDEASDAARTSSRVMPHPVLGFYGPDSMMWRINREAVLLGAGPAALLLQIAHPMVAEGVAQHSNFEGDPFGRLRRTLNTTMDLVFGDGPAAERAVRRLNGVHATIKGNNESATPPEPYRALDPALLLWVQATLIVTSVQAYERWVGTLTRDQREAFWQEARRVGPRIGIPLERSPASWPALIDYWRAMLAPNGPIQVSATARRLAPTIIRPPLPNVPARVVDLLNLPGLALLPERIRVGFGIDWSPQSERRADLLRWGVRLWVASVPAGWRSMPQARAAFARTKTQASAQDSQASRAPSPTSATGTRAS